jgi:protein-arginine kinase activator protein McsA
LTELEKLQRALAEAIQLEDYEKAAQVRDRLKKIQSAKS